MEEDDSPELLPLRWSWLILPTIAFDFLSSVADAASTAADNVALSCAAHIRYQQERAAFQEAASREIETLIK